MKKLIILLSSLFVFQACQEQTSQPKAIEKQSAGELNIYSHRFYDADKQLIQQFENQTGIKVNVKKDKADKLIALLEAEGKTTDADLLITVDAGRLGFAKSLHLLQPFESSFIEKTVPKHLKDSENYWVALTQRARVIAYDTALVKPSELSTYEDLTSEKWKGEINVRSSQNLYNQSLLASVIAHQGEEKALGWAKGIVANMARAPKGNDRDQVKQVALGEGKLAIINTYYLGKLLNSPNQMEVEAANRVALFFPNQNTTGTHINVSGVGITAHAPNKANALKFIEFLLSEKAQSVYAESNYEYPVNPKVKPSALLQSWGEFKADTLDLSKLSEHNAQAVSVFEKAAWN
ncbi:MAG: Fe(3+) ABC transporter substrate-binding protein [Flavobacteriales bacterium]